jgi:hypothetical protein
MQPTLDKLLLNESTLDTSTMLLRSLYVKE